MSTEHTTPLSILDQPITRRELWGLGLRAAGALAIGKGIYDSLDSFIEDPISNVPATPEPKQKQPPQPLYGTTLAGEITDIRSKEQVSYEGAFKFLRGVAFGILGTAAFAYGKFLDAQKPVTRISERKINDDSPIDEIPKNITLDQILNQMTEHTPEDQFPNNKISYTSPPPFEIDETNVPRIITKN